MAWHVAASLDRLLSQLNARAPRRSKGSDGAIGDTAHSNRSSDHNPWYGPGTVTARDFTHDPGGGLDGQWLADRLVASRDPRIKYIIWSRRIVSGNGGPNPWTWRPYGGSNAHTKHVHVSVVAAPSCEDARDWALDGGAAAPVTPGLPKPAATTMLTTGSTGQGVKALQAKLNRDYPDYSRLTADGKFGPATAAVVKEFQRRSGLVADGIAGPATLARLGL
jgi:hypothetical protein